VPNETPEDAERVERREFLKKVGKVAATAPAVALLLSAHAKPASAQAGAPYGGGGSGGRGGSGGFGGSGGTGGIGGSGGCGCGGGS
jgi:hypothetical protein